MLSVNVWNFLIKSFDFTSFCSQNGFSFKQIQWYNTIILINNETKEQQIDNEDDYIIPLHLFEVEKLFILLKLPF